MACFHVSLHYSAALEPFTDMGAAIKSLNTASYKLRRDGSYEISLAKPYATIRNVEIIPGTRIYLYRERGWAEHQDVVVFGRPSYDEAWLTLNREPEESVDARSNSV